MTLASSSLDGHLRVYDLVKFKLFREKTSDTPSQILSLATGPGKDILFAGGFDPYNISVFSLKMGAFLEDLEGHEAPVHLLAYSEQHQTLISGSWDRTVRLWKPFLKGRNQETLNMVDKLVELKVDSSGNKFYVSTIRNEIHMYDVEHASVVGIVDLGKYVNMSIATMHKNSVKYKLRYFSF